MNGARRIVTLCGVVISLFAVGAQAAEPLAPANPAVTCCLIPAGTPVMIELTQLVTSRTAKEGQSFALKLAEDVVVGGAVLARAGATGAGEVVDAAPGTIGGRPGKLVLAARWVESGSVRLPLRSFHLAGSGSDSSRTTLAAMTFTPYVGILALGIQGGNIDYAAGTRAMAKIAADTPVVPSAEQPAPPSVASAPPEPIKEKTP